jgi:hypothetical protein
MDKAIEYEIKGLKCDNPECDFVDMNIPFEEYESYVNKPCPKCGQPLLTEADFASSVLVATMVDNLNKFLPPTPEGAKIGHAFINMGGDGSMEMIGDVTTEDLADNKIKCIDCANFQNMTAMLLFGMECKACVDCIIDEKCLGKNFETKDEE